MDLFGGIVKVWRVGGSVLRAPGVLVRGAQLFLDGITGSGRIDRILKLVFYHRDTKDTEKTLVIDDLQMIGPSPCSLCLGGHSSREKMR